MPKPSTPIKALWFTLSVLGVIFLWLAIPTMVYELVKLTNIGQGGERIPPEFGIVGDLFGSVNALFAGLAFLFIVFSLNQARKSNELNARAIAQASEALALQREELKMQREELIASREVLKDQAEAQKELIKAIRHLSRVVNRLR